MLQYIILFSKIWIWVSQSDWCLIEWGTPSRILIQCLQPLCRDCSTNDSFCHCFSVQHIVNQVSEKEGLALSMAGYKAKILLTCFLVHFVTLCVNFISLPDLNKWYGSSTTWKQLENLAGTFQIFKSPINSKMSGCNFCYLDYYKYMEYIVNFLRDCSELTVSFWNESFCCNVAA